MDSYRVEAVYFTAVSDDVVAQLGEALPEHGGSCLADEGRVTARVTVQAEHAVQAATGGLELLAGLLPERVDAHEPATLTVATWQDHLSRLAPGMPGAMGLSDVADFLGTSRQQVHRMRKEPSVGFPEPVATTSSGPIWWQGHVEEFATQWRRQRGRPPQTRKGYMVEDGEWRNIAHNRPAGEDFVR